MITNISCSRRRRVALRALAGVAALALSVGVAGCASDTSSDAVPVVKDVTATGRELATKFLTLLQNNDATGLDAFLDTAFQIQRADGSFAGKAEYLKNPAKVKSFELSPDLSAVMSGNLITVRYAIMATETINGKSFSKGEAPRLSTFAWHDGTWHLVSHANFNLPADTSAPVLDDASATGRALAEQFIDILKRKDRDALAAFLAGAFQIQRADGTSADRAEYLTADINISSSELGPEVEGIQEGNTLTVRWSVKLVETVNGKPTSEVFAPRLSTFIWEGGTWALLAHANFNPPVG